MADSAVKIVTIMNIIIFMVKSYTHIRRMEYKTMTHGNVLNVFLLFNCEKKFSVVSFYLVCDYDGMDVLVFLVVMNDWNCILQCHPLENSKLLPLLLFSMNSVAP